MNTDRYEVQKFQNPNHKIQTITNVQISNVKNYFWNLGFWICLGFSALALDLGFSLNLRSSVFIRGFKI